MPPTPTRLIPSEVGKRLRKKPSTVIAMIRAGVLPAIDTRMPGSKRPRFVIDLRDVEAFEEQRTIRPRGNPEKRAKRLSTADPDFIQYY